MKSFNMGSFKRSVKMYLHSAEYIMDWIKELASKNEIDKFCLEGPFEHPNELSLKKIDFDILNHTESGIQVVYPIYDNCDYIGIAHLSGKDILIHMDWVEKAGSTEKTYKIPDDIPVVDTLYELNPILEDIDKRLKKLEGEDAGKS